MKPALWLLAGCSVSIAIAQEPSYEEREALCDQFLQARNTVRGGKVQARWLADGSSMRYRQGPRTMFVDPAEGLPRKATKEDRARDPMSAKSSSQGEFKSPAGDRSITYAGRVLVASGAGIEAEVALTEDEGDAVYWRAGPEGWAADGSAYFAMKTDASAVHKLPIVEYREAVESIEFPRYNKAGTAFAQSELAVFHLPGGERTVIDPGSEEDLYIFPLGWREGDAELLFLRMNRCANRLDLMAGDPATGESRVILTDTQQTFVGGLDFVIGGWREYFKPIEGTDRFLWLSERDGWRHIYQYDYDGELVGRVTEGEFPVLRIAGVDAKRGRAYVMANAEERLYDTHLYRADLAGGTLQRLTEGTGEHEVDLSPSLLYFVDVHSSLDRPPTSELRDVEGLLICVLDEADTSPLDEMGAVPPEPFVVKAADGETDLYGVLFKPTYFDPATRYPIIDFIYTGPFITAVPNDFELKTSFLAQRARAMAQMGFVTFIVDPRGTVERSKAFQDASFGRIGEIEIPDHVATLRQLAEDRPYIDLEHVGVRGGSWGGYFTLRAMLTAPDVFHVGVSSAPGELTEAAAINEPYMGLPEDNPDGYAAGLNAPLAGNLAGKLLIVHGTADVNAPFSVTMRMVQALIEADKPFDLLVLPGGTHYFQGAHLRYANKRVRAYFTEHLRGEPSIF